MSTFTICAMLAVAQLPVPKGAPGKVAYLPFDMIFSSNLVLLEIKDVCDELKLDKNQLAAVDRVLTEAKRRYAEAVARAETLDQEAGSRHMTEAKRAILRNATPELEKALRAEQMKRYYQICLQDRKREALTDPEVWDALKLREEQRKATVRIKDETLDRLRDVMRRQGFAGPEDSDRLEAEAIERTLVLFTPEQRKVWDEMRGEPFKMPPGSLLRTRK